MAPTILTRRYEYAVELIQKGLAYVCDLSPEEMQGHTGATLTPAGQGSPLPGPAH